MPAVLLELRFRPVTPDDHPALLALLTGEAWPYHHHRRLPAPLAERWLADGAYALPQALAFRIDRGATLLGLMHLDDLDDIDDGEPVLNIRLAAAARGHGVGRAAVRWLCAHAFERWPGLRRIGAQTRADNFAMRRVLQVCGFAKEAHHRLAWVSEDGARHDAIGYGLLREDWASGGVTPVNWRDTRAGS